MEVFQKIYQEKFYKSKFYCFEPLNHLHKTFKLYNKNNLKFFDKLHAVQKRNCKNLYTL